MDKKAMGQRIAERRKSLKMKQAYLAELIDISSNHLSNIELGKENTTLETFVKICESLNCNPDYLLLGTMRSNNISQNIVDSLLLCSERDIEIFSEIVKVMVTRNNK